MGDKQFEELCELFRQTEASREAREEFAEAWAAMINEVLPVESSVRNIFTVEKLAPGAVPFYTNDVQPFKAWYLPKYGQAPQNIIELDEVTVPTFELTGHESYKLRDAKHGRINIAERTMLRLKDSMVEQEEDAGWAVLKAACDTDNTISVNGETGLTKAVINRAVGQMESNRGYKVTDIYASPKGVEDIRSWAPTSIDPVTQHEIFVNAGIGEIWGATLHIVHFLEDTEAYFIDARPNRLGYMPIRAELETWDDPNALSKFRAGVIAYEELGFVVMDKLCIVKATLNR